MDTTPVGRPMEILLVEDSLADARLTMQVLRSGSVQHRLSLVRDGEEAMQFLKRNGVFAHAPRPDVILLDLLLPRKRGLDVLEEIRQDDQLKDIPVVVLTGSQNDADRLKSSMLGVNCYLTKPVNFDNFIAVVRQLKRYALHNVILPHGAEDH